MKMMVVVIMMMIMKLQNKKKMLLFSRGKKEKMVFFIPRELNTSTTVQNFSMALQMKKVGNRVSPPVLTRVLTCVCLVFPGKLSPHLCNFFPW